MKHFILLSMFILLVLCNGVTVASAQTATAPSGSGTVGDPYLIATLNNLYWVTQNSSSWGANFLQTADIDASASTTWDGGAGHTPIGNSTTNFTGVYDGQGFVIDNLFIDRADGGQGLFGFAEGAQITGVGVTNCTITALGNSHLVGALAGRITNSVVTECYSSGSIIGEGSFVGGLVGQNITSTITDCNSACNISTTTELVGGLVGHLNAGSITNSYATGSVSGSIRIGGLVGGVEGASITNSYATGNVSGISTLGGLVGDNLFSIGTISNSFWDTQTTGQSTSDGGIGKTTAEMKLAVTFLPTGWSAATWNIGDGINDGYPYLDWQNPAGTALAIQPPSGSGTVGDPYLIATLDNLYWVTQNSGSWGANFLQTADIDASATTAWDGGAGFTPIGNLTTSFTGVYDGDGHTLTGLFISRGATNYIGLFGIIDNATITDIGLINVSITGDNSVGGLTGFASNDSFVSNSYSTGSVSGDLEVGGLAGEISNSSTISNSYATASVSGGDGVGGLVGRIEVSATVSNSYSTGNVSGASFVGGLVGLNASTISNSYSRGNVTRTSGSSTRLGAFAGRNSSGFIQNSYSTGTVNFGTGQGFVGFSIGSPTYTNNFFDSQMSGQTSGIGATAKTTAEMKLAVTFLPVGWSAAEWYKDSGVNDGYPYLEWQNPAGTALAIQPPSGSGTVGDPYLIATLDNLYWVTQNSSTWDKNFKQTADIDASASSTWDGGAGFTPIGNSPTSFTGVYDGDGHTITGLFISRGSINNVALFGRITNATITDIGLINVSVTGDVFVGGLIGQADGSTFVSNSYSTGSITGPQVVGGLVGQNANSSTVSNSYSTASVSGASALQLGGLVGINAFGATISNSYSTGSVSGASFVGGLVGTNSGTISDSYSTGSVSGDNSVGGLVGRTTSDATISNSYSRGNVTRTSGSNTSVGGFAGTNSGTTIDNSYSTGSVNFGTGQGFVGTSSGSPTYTNNFFDSQTSGQTSSAGATAKTTAVMKLAVTFLPVGWSAAEWYKDSGVNDGYPYLEWQNPAGTALAIQPPSGSGTVGDPYLIATLEDLYWVTQNSGSWDKNFLQTADIDASASTIWDGGAGFTPIGNLTTNFTGVYDGDGHTITGLFISRGVTDYVALFGIIDNATITDIGLITISTTGNEYVGGLIGLADGSSVVSNSYSTGSVTGDERTGGLAGQNNNSSTISNSYSTASVSGAGQLGGLVGDNILGATINNSYSTGSVNGASLVGGLVGTNSGTISDSYSTGSVSGVASIGGLVGDNNSTISNSYSTASVSGGFYTGGLVGVNSASCTISNSYSRGNVTRTSGSSETVGGFVGHNISGIIQNSYSTGSVSFGTGQGFVGTEAGSPSYTNNFFDSEASGQTTGTGATAKTTAEMTRGYTFLAAGWSAAAWLRDTGTNDDYPYLAWENPAGTPLQWPQIVLTSGDNQNETISTALANPFLITVTDENANAVAGVPITFAIATSPASATGQLLSVTNTTTDASGEASTLLTLGNKTGAYTVTATSANLTGSPITFNASAASGTATTITLTSGDAQGATVNAALANPFVVTVKDVGGNPVTGVNVTFDVASTPVGAAGQLLSVTNAITNASGEASSVLTVGDKSGTYTVTAVSTGLTGSPIAFAATATAGTAAVLSLTSGNNQFSAYGLPVPLPFVVTATDGVGNPVAGQNVTFAITTTPIGAVGQSLTVTNTVTNGSGQASAILTLGDKLGAYTVTATSAGLTGSPVAFTATATPGMASRIVLSFGNNQQGAVHTKFLIPFAVSVVDAANNLIPGYHVDFAIVKAPDSASGQKLDPPYMKTETDGVAGTLFRFGNKTGEYWVSAKAIGLEDSVVFKATALPGPVRTMSALTGNGQNEQNGQAGEELPTPVKVEIKDTSGNAVPNAEVMFSLTSIPPGATGQRLSVAGMRTDSLGQASTQLTLGNLSGDYTVTASYAHPGVNPVMFTATAASPTTSVEGSLATIPSDYVLHNAYPNPFNPSTTIRFGVPERSQVTVEVYDLAGRRINVPAEGEFEAGTYQVRWSVQGGASSVYFVRMHAASRLSGRQFQDFRKIVLLK